MKLLLGALLLLPAFLHAQSDSASLFKKLCADFKGMGMEDASSGYLERAIRLHPNDGGAYSNHGFKYIGKGDYTKATELLNQDLKLDPEELCKGGSDRVGNEIMTRNPARKPYQAGFNISQMGND